MSFLKNRVQNALRNDAGKFFLACLDSIIDREIGNNPDADQVPEEIHAAAVMVRAWWESVRPK